jgi:hypothetical protein
MRLRLGAQPLLAVLAASLLAGCGKNPAAPSNVQGPSEQMYIVTSLDSVPAFTAEPVYNDPNPVLAARVRPGAAPASVQAAISPIHFWRTFWSQASAFQFTYFDPDTAGRPLLAEVTIDRALRGDFHILPGMPGDPTTPDTTHMVDKPIAEGWHRRLLFHRVHPDTLGLAWRLVAASPIRVARPGNTVQIVSLHLQAMSGLDTVITDPNALMTLHGIPRFAPDDSVTVTVTSLRNDDVAVMYTMGRREMMHNNGDNTYTLGFNTGSFTEWRYLGVNVFTHGTLFDDTLPYDSETWILPYTITSEPVVDYLP